MATQASATRESITHLRNMMTGNLICTNKVPFADDIYGSFLPPLPTCPVCRNLLKINKKK